MGVNREHSTGVLNLTRCCRQDVFQVVVTTTPVTQTRVRVNKSLLSVRLDRIVERKETRKMSGRVTPRVEVKQWAETIRFGSGRDVRETY